MRDHETVSGGEVEPWGKACMEFKFLEASTHARATVPSLCVCMAQSGWR
jgi:hypothetical protein